MAEQIEPQTEPQTVDVVVDISDLTWDEFLMLMGDQSIAATNAEVISIFKRVVKSDIGKLKFIQVMPALQAALQTAMMQAMNPNA